jgi:hypothetical protein
LKPELAILFNRQNLGCKIGVDLLELLPRYFIPPPKLQEFKLEPLLFLKEFRKFV